MKTLVLFFIIYLPFIGYGQAVQFTKDSIPIVGGQVIFNVDFKYDLNKEEFRERARFYLDSLLNPYSGQFHSDNDTSMLCRITDYVELDASIFQTLGMYMSYSLDLGFQDGTCHVTVKDITYMERAYFEAREKEQRKLNMPEYSGKDIMIDKKYKLIMKREASELLTEASLERINGLFTNLGASFAKE